MATRKQDVVAAALAAARELPDVEEGIACAGTKLECRTLKVRGKAFAFFRPEQVMLKLDASLPAARAATKDDERVRAGNGGWVQMQCGDGVPIDGEQLRHWLAESYALFASAPAAKKKVAKKPAAKKKPAARKRS